MEWTSFHETRIYGHRENDLVRLPDPTNVLKYPHVALTGPAQRGYVASASSILHAYPAWEAFDEYLVSLVAAHGTINFPKDIQVRYFLVVDRARYRQCSEVYTNGEWIQIRIPTQELNYYLEFKSLPIMQYVTSRWIIVVVMT